jgi:hypothetical protein
MSTSAQSSPAEDWGVTGTQACFVDVVSRSAHRYDQKKHHGGDADAMNGFHALISVARSDRGRSAVATIRARPAVLIFCLGASAEQSPPSIDLY